MTPDAQAARVLLQDRAARFQSTDHWRAEQADEALDELAAHPERVGEPSLLVRNALSNARKKLQRRQAIRERVLLGPLPERPGRVMRPGRFLPTVTWTSSGYDIDAYAAIDLLQSLANLRPADRILLEMVGDGFEAAEMAAMLHLPVQRVRERLSRARARARAVLAAAA